MRMYVMKPLGSSQPKGVLPMDQFNQLMLAMGEVKGTVTAVAQTQEQQRLDMHAGFTNLDTKTDKIREEFIKEQAHREAENKAANLRMDDMEPIVEKMRTGLNIMGIFCAAVTLILTWAELIQPWLVERRGDVVNSEYVREETADVQSHGLEITE